KPPLRIIFAGTPAFAVRHLQALIDSEHQLIGVYTQPDRPAGRGKILQASPVKHLAEAAAIPVYQPASLRDAGAQQALAQLHADLLVVVAYGLILPQAVLDTPRLGCLNVHASLLPRWRGAAPIQAAILAGDETTGISLMAMTAGLDCGPVYAIDEVVIGDDETAAELHDRLAELGGRSLVEKLDDILEGRAKAMDQDEALATYAPKIVTSDARIDWSADAVELARRVRAYNPFPGAFFFAGDDRIKVWRAAPVEGDAPAGTVLQCDRDGIIIACGAGALRLDELQLAGKRRVLANAFPAQLDLSGQRLN
ncbi:MAG: methionyl-tRNA formyltransferase, partial [Woeseiaceae bacterium]